MDLLIGDVFRAAAQAVPDRVAAALGECRLTYRELDTAANRYAHALEAHGVGVRDRVATWSGTDIEMVPLFAGLAKLGAVFAPANALLGIDEATEMIGLARPSVLVVDETHRADGRVVAERLGLPMLVLGDMVDPTTESGDVDAAGLREADTHVVFFTSGSTGKSKGVVLSHRVNYLRSHPGAQLEPRGATVCIFPLFHMGAWTIALQAFQTQSTLVVVPETDGPSICDAIERWRATHFNAIPAVWQRVLDHLDERAAAGRPRDLSSLRIVDSGTSATPPALLEAIKVALPGATRRVFYGSTEAGAVTLLRDEDMSRKPGSCGTVQHSCRIRIDDDTGELQVRGPLNFEGYFEDADATAAAFTADGWFRTGDVAARDEEGFLSIVGRVRDVIRTGGEAVAPAEVEAAIAGHPAFVDVAVVGIPDVRYGETICAVAVLRADATAPTLAELQSFAEHRLAKFKRPRRLELVDHIPRTPATNQVQRRLIVEQLSRR